MFWLYSDNLRCFDCIQRIYDVFDCIWSAHEILLYSEHLRILIVFKALTMARRHWDQKPSVLSRILELSADWAKRSRWYHVTHSRWSRVAGWGKEGGEERNRICVWTWNDQDRHFSRRNLEWSRQTFQSSEPGMIKTDISVVGTGNDQDRDISVEGGGLREEENTSCIWMEV